MFWEVEDRTGRYLPVIVLNGRGRTNLVEALRPTLGALDREFSRNYTL